MSAYISHSDEQLIDLCKADDELAFAEIYNRYWDKLLAVAINRLNHEKEAEECVQDVFLSLWKRRESLVLRHQLNTYLWVAVKYQVINRLDKRFAKRNLDTTPITDLFAVPSIEAQIFERELLANINDSVARLPEKCRMVYLLSREDGKSNKEIAAELGISEKTVEGHMTKALKDIRSNLFAAAPLFVVITLLK